MNFFQVFPIEDAFRIGVAVIVFLSGIISILYVIWWGFLMIISGGNEEKIKPAINHIRYAVIGILFIVGVLFVVPVFMNLIWLTYGDYAKPRAVFQTIQEISSKLLGTQTEVGFPTESTDFGTDVKIPADYDSLPPF
jgi:Type IV secretion system pilin